MLAAIGLMQSEYHFFGGIFLIVGVAISLKSRNKLDNREYAFIQTLLHWLIVTCKFRIENTPEKSCFLHFNTGKNILNISKDHIAKLVEQTAWRPRFYVKAVQVRYEFGPLLTSGRSILLSSPFITYHFNIPFMKLTYWHCKYIVVYLFYVDRIWAPRSPIWVG